MASRKDKNDITAEELIGKLGKNADDKMFADKFMPIDMPDGEPDTSDGDLDISELMRKYLPEYEEGSDDTDDEADVASFDDGTFEQLNMGYDDLFDDGAEEEEHNSISFADSIFSEYDITSDSMSEPDDTAEMNGSREEIGEDASGHEIESERTRRFLSSLLHKGHEDTADMADTLEEDEKEDDGEPESAPEVSGPEDDTLGDEFDESSEVTDAGDDTADAEQTAEAEDMFADLFTEESEEPEKKETADAESDTYGDEFDDAEEEPDEKSDEFSGYDERDDEYDDEYWELGEKDKSRDEKDDFEEEKKDVDPTDINLMIAFDIDSDDEETKNRAKELGDKLETKHASRPRKKYSLDRAEYVDKSQTAEIRAEFKKKRTSLTVRAILCAVCAAVLFVFENITTLTQLATGHAQQFTGAVDPALYPVVYIMVSLQITLLACLCAIPEIIDGVRFLLKGAPKPSTMTALLAVASIIYAAVLSSLIKSPNEPVMYGFVVAMSAFLTIIGEKLNNKREMMNFRVIAGKKPKNVVRRLDDEESECESNAFPSSDRGCDVMKIEKTDFISNFFARLRSPDQTIGTVMTFIMSVTVAVGVLFGIISNFRSGVDGAGAWRIIFATMFMLAPASIQIAFSYPFYRANRAASEYDSAIIGDVSLEEYSNASIISFDDKNVFPSYSVKVQNIRIYNNARIDRVLYYASSVFAYAGGPLQDVFEIATKDMGTSENVRIFDTESGFLATQVDGVNIIFGSYKALTSRGLEIPQNAADDDVDFSDDLAIMYMFRESVLVAKMYIKYDMDEDIDVILKQFAGDGLYVCVRTFDPNIDEKMVARKLGVKHVPLKVVRYVSTDEVGKYEEKVDSGLVTSSSPKSLLQVISYCEKVKLARKTNTACGVISLVIGVLLMMFMVLSNSISALSSFLIAVYQTVWIITMVIASNIHIR